MKQERQFEALTGMARKDLASKEVNLMAVMAVRAVQSLVKNRQLLATLQGIFCDDLINCGGIANEIFQAAEKQLGINR